MAQGRTMSAEQVTEVVDAAVSATLGITTHRDAADRARIQWMCYHRLRERYQGVVASLVPVKAEALERSWGDLLIRAHSAITDDKLDAASAKDLAIIAGIATEKRALVRGEPTDIIAHTHEAAGSLDRLCEAIVAERERRRALPVVVSADRDDADS